MNVTNEEKTLINNYRKAAEKDRQHIRSIAETSAKVAAKLKDGEG